MELDVGGLEFGGGFELAFIWGDEEGDVRAIGGEGADGGAQGVELAGGIEAAFGGEFLAALGYEANFVRVDFEGDFDDVGVVRHFEVHAGGEGFPEGIDVVILNMAAVFAEVDGDAVGAGFFG